MIDEGLKPLLGHDLQLGFVVRDLDKALDHWVNVLQVGPFLHLEEGTGRPANPSLYKGVAQRIDLRLAFGYMGDVQIELIEQVNDAPSPYQEFLAKGQEGLQHFGFAVPDFARAHQGLLQAGYQIELEIPIAGSSEAITYFSSPKAIGPMVEIVPPQWRAARAAVKAHLRDLKGPDPILRHQSYGAFLAYAGVTFD